MKRGGSRPVPHHTFPAGGPPPKRFIIGGLVMTAVLALCAFTMVQNYATMHARTHSRRDVKVDDPIEDITTASPPSTSPPTVAPKFHQPPQLASMIQTHSGVQIGDEEFVLTSGVVGDEEAIALIPFPNGDTFQHAAHESVRFHVDAMDGSAACSSSKRLGVFDHTEAVTDGAIRWTVCDEHEGDEASSLSRILLEDMSLEDTLNEDYREYLGPTRVVRLERGGGKAHCNLILSWQEPQSTDADDATRHREEDHVDEGYQMCIDWNESNDRHPSARYTVQIASWKPIGVLHALRTFMQLAWTTRLDCGSLNSHPQTKVHRVPSGCIRDAPKLPYRGLHVDTARHFHSTQTIEAILRAMSRVKLNRLHWHISDDQGWRLESTVYPGLHSKGASRGPPLNGVKGNKYKGLPYEVPVYHTHNDVSWVIGYAKRRGIIVIPEVDLPAHAAALFAGLQVHGLGDAFGVRIDASRGNADCAAEENTKNGLTLAPNCMGGTFGVMHASKAAVEIARNIFSEVCHVFADSPVIHIGGDEAEMLRDGLWAARPKPCDLDGCAALNARDFSAMQAVLMDELVAIIEDPNSCPKVLPSTLYIDPRQGNNAQRQRTRRAAVWDETVMELRKGGVPKSAQVIPMMWRDDRITIDDIVKQYRAAGVQDPHLDVSLVLTPKTRLYFDYLQHPQPASNVFWPLQRPPTWMKYKAVTLERSFMTHSMLPSAEKWMSSLVYGVEGCAWTELIPNATVLDYQLFPRMYALADAAWTLRDPSSAEGSLTRAFAILQQKISLLEQTSNVSLRSSSSQHTCKWLCQGKV